MIAGVGNNLEKSMHICWDTWQKHSYNSITCHQRKKITPIWSQNAVHNRQGHPPPFNKEDTKYVQAVAGTLLYYGRAVNNAILPVLSAIATELATPMAKIKEKIINNC